MATLPAAPASQEWIDDSRYECVSGVLRERPVPGYEHAKMQKVCVRLLDAIAEAHGGQVLSEWSIGDGRGAWLTPDVMFALPGFRTAHNGHLCPPPPPHLVIEVASPGQNDLVKKAKDYKPYSVPYYWIVDPFNRTCYEVLMNQQYIVSVLKDGPDDYITAGDAGIQLKVSDIWAAYDRM
jgi:Uma2 family endonuclease